MTPAEIVELIRRYRLAVVSSVAADGAPQSAVVGFAISNDLEIVFDTLASTRKCLQTCYFTVYPDGRERLGWAGITHVRVRPTWIRMSDFKQDPPRIVEVTPQP